VLQYQTIISRNIGAQDAAVLTVGAIHAGADNNVIPASATIKVNLRWFKEETRQILIENIKRINQGIAIANGLPPELYPSIKMKGNAYPLENDPVLTKKITHSLSEIFSSQNIITDTPASMASEDFQHLIKGNKKTTSTYINVGIVNPDLFAKAISEGKKAPFFLHANNYQVDLRAIPLGTIVGTTALLSSFKK
jgi:metal-dependent amidase/aminoacylase/carboxypeptidase family protein